MSKINIILYPRTYNKRGAENLHSVQGVTEDGRSVNVKLRVPEDKKDNQFAPSIVEFSRDDLDAKMSCQADPENGPDNRFGVLLFTNCIRTKNKDVETYEAQWGAILSFRKSTPSPLIGIGRISINKNTAKTSRINRDIIALEEAGNTDEVEAKKKELLKPENYSYPVIMYYPEDMYSGIATDIEGFKSHALESLSKYHYDGHSPGLMIRLVNNKNRIVTDSYYELISKNIQTEARVQTPFETIDFFIEHIEKNLNVDYFKDSALRIEFIPIIRVASAIYSIRFYAQKQNYKFIENHFYSSVSTSEVEADPVLSRLATRVSYSSDYDKMLLAKSYSISAPLGHPARLDSKGRFAYLFESEIAKKAQEDVEDSDLIETKIGLSFSSLPTRAIWLVNKENNIISTEEQQRIDNSKKDEVNNSDSSLNLNEPEVDELIKKIEDIESVSESDTSPDDLLLEIKDDEALEIELDQTNSLINLNEDKKIDEVPLDDLSDLEESELNQIVEQDEFVEDNEHLTEEEKLTEESESSESFSMHQGKTILLNSDDTLKSIENNNDLNEIQDTNPNPVEIKNKLNTFLNKIKEENISNENKGHDDEKNEEILLETKHEEKKSVDILPEKERSVISDTSSKKATGLAAFMKNRKK